MNFEKFNNSSYLVRHHRLAIVHEAGFSSYRCRVGMKTIAFGSKEDLRSKWMIFTRKHRQENFPRQC